MNNDFKHSQFAHCESGVISSMLINSGSLTKSFADLDGRIVSSMADSWNAGIILQVLTIGGLIALITKMGGARAIAESLSKRAKSPASAQVIAWIMGLFIFFDDYANSLIVGPIMKPITDKMKISRGRYDKEDKELWCKGHFYQDGNTNEMFKVFLSGCNYGIMLSNLENR